MISSYPPRPCRIGAFCQEAREFIAKRHPEREVVVISHIDGAGDGVFPIIDTSKRRWWRRVAKRISKLDPCVVHIEHERSLYEYVDGRGRGDRNEGFLDLLAAISDWPIVVEPHTMPARLRDDEAEFAYNLCDQADVVLFKHPYQRWRLDWTFSGLKWKTPRNILVVPPGARPDKRWGPADIPALRAELGLDRIPGLSMHLIGLVGWIQDNKRWDILISMWSEIAHEIQARSGEDWDLLAAGAMRDPFDAANYEHGTGEVQRVELPGLAHYYEFVPQGDMEYKMMAVCDFLVFLATDEAQSGTLAKIIALNKPYIIMAPLEGLTAQTLESEGGLSFTTKEMLRDKVIRMACDEKLRMELGSNLQRYLENVVSWEMVAARYDEAYQLARQAKETGKKVELPTEF
jgi:glycosyltransferase involved in cell wall biosynthesis